MQKRTTALALLLALGLLMLFPVSGGAAPKQQAPAPHLSNLLADYAGTIREAEPRADGIKHVDTPAMIQRLKELHATTYVYLIWHASTDWDDLRNEFLPAANEAGIDVWVYLVPPTECTPACSLPFGKDYVRWGQEIAALSLEYPNLKAWAIDDFNHNLGLFTPAYIQRMQEAAKAANPDLLFLPQVYSVTITPSFVDKYAPVIDGLIMAYRDDPYRNTQVTESLPGQLDYAAGLLEPHGKPLVLMVYASALSNAPVLPSASYVDQVVRTGLEYTRDGRIAGLITYVLKKDLQPEPPSLNRARTGNGRFSLTVPGGAPTGADVYGEVSQTVSVDPNAGSYSLSFWQTDSYWHATAARGYHFKQLLVDDQVVWEKDVAPDVANLWVEETVDLTPYLAGKSSAKLAFRLHDKQRVNNFFVDVRIDDLAATGFSVANPGFEAADAWSYTRNHQAFLGAFDIYDPERPIKAFAAVKAQYGPHSLPARVRALELPQGEATSLLAKADQVLERYLAGDDQVAANLAGALAGEAEARGLTILAEQARLVEADLNQ